jgi:hypothetical protein
MGMISTPTNNENNKVLAVAAIRQIMRENGIPTFDSVYAVTCRPDVMKLLKQTRGHWTAAERNQAYTAACLELGAK